MKQTFNINNQLDWLHLFLPTTLMLYNCDHVIFFQFSLLVLCVCIHRHEYLYLSLSVYVWPDYFISIVVHILFWCDERKIKNNLNHLMFKRLGHTKKTNKVIKITRNTMKFFWFTVLVISSSTFLILFAYIYIYMNACFSQIQISSFHQVNSWYILVEWRFAYYHRYNI